MATSRRAAAASGPPSARELVEQFYRLVWNEADEGVARRILDAGFRFRGSLGSERVGPDAFIEYLRSVHRALGDYRCIIADLIATGDRAAAKMIFRGRHRGRFFGVEATGRDIEWAGAAFFRTDQGHIVELWVLGDVDQIRRQLGAADGGSPAIGVAVAGNREPFL